MNFWTAVQSCFRQYAGFSGRAARVEYWFWVLFTTVVNGVLHSLEPGGGDGSPGVLSGAWSLATFLPSIAVTVRRLHDTDRSGWWLLLPGGAFLVVGFWAMLVLIMAPGGGAAPDALSELGPEAIGLMLATVACLGLCVLFLVWMVTRGTAGANRFGPDPLAALG